MLADYPHWPTWLEKRNAAGEVLDRRVFASPADVPEGYDLPERWEAGVVPPPRDYEAELAALRAQLEAAQGEAAALRKVVEIDATPPATEPTPAKAGRRKPEDA